MSQPIDRRRFIQQMALLPFLLNGCGGGSGGGANFGTSSNSGTETNSGNRTAAGKGTKKPNVLIIVIDDLNDWVGFLGGHPQVETPNMDALAAQSTVFRRAYCNDPLCNPSRSSAWSGLSVQDTKVFDNKTSLHIVNPNAVVLPKYLVDHGYAGKLLGKVYHSFPAVNQPVPPIVPAANHVCSGNATMHEGGIFDWAPLDIDDNQMPDYQFVEQARKFLSQSHKSPFFLSVGMLRTHVAWYVPRKYYDLYPLNSIQVPDVPFDDLNDLPPAGKATALKFNFHKCITSQGLWPSAVQAYLASISFVDAQIGRLLDALRSSPYADNTLVMLWSDNGFHLGEKFHWHKQALWEQATRVPFLIKAPGNATESIIDSPVSLIDMMPTVLDYCGLPPPYTLAGRSLRPLIENSALPWNYPVLTTYEQHNYAIRTSLWRYIRYANGDQELYDEQVDPNEWTNVAANPNNAAIIAQLDAFMPPKP